MLKFPHAVLDSFVKSFGTLNELAVNSETAVMEEYLVQTWRNNTALAAISEPPNNVDSIALMRLALQAQTPDKQRAILDAWSILNSEDQEVLRTEMARTGIHGQFFERGPKFESSMGPSFLVYYSPAFIRTLAPAEAKPALSMLAEVYRQSRKLWPLRPTNSNNHAVS